MPWPNRSDQHPCPKEPDRRRTIGEDSVCRWSGASRILAIDRKNPTQAAAKCSGSRRQSTNTPGRRGITASASGKSMTGFTSCAIAGGLYCWGFSDDGQDNDTESPTRVGGLSQPEAVATSHGTSCAIFGGGLYCWGSNDYGEIGDGTNIYRPAPTRVPGISGVTAVSTNSSMTCAVADGKVYCWGDGRL